MTMKQQRARILVIDDDLALLDLLVDTLTTIGYEAVGMSDAIAALSRIKSESFDLIVTDVKMPEMDGISLLKKIRRHFPKLPVLFITAYATPEMIGVASPDGILAKPFRITHIEELIENTLHNRVVSAPAQQSQRVLIVDANDDFREYLTETLRASEYVPLSVDCGTDAMAQLAGGHVDVLVVDSHLGDMSVDALVVEVRHQYPSVKIIQLDRDLPGVTGIEHPSHDGPDILIAKPLASGSIVDIIRDLNAARRV
jgi:DNA-binding NtrC family response regulator